MSKSAFLLWWGECADQESRESYSLLRVVVLSQDEFACAHFPDHIIQANWFSPGRLDRVHLSQCHPPWYLLAQQSSNFGWLAGPLVASDSVDLLRGLRFCCFNKFLDAAAAGPGIYFENHCSTWIDTPQALSPEAMVDLSLGRSSLWLNWRKIYYKRRD